MTQPLPVVSLFSGTGGLDLAAETVTSPTEAPVRDGTAHVRVSVEWGDEECDTLRANFDGLVVQGEITQLSAAEILDVGGMGPGDPTLVIGGPPCTPFSKSGFWLDYKRESRDPNASLLDDYVRIVDHARPEAFLLENVQGLTYKTHADQFARLIQSLTELGYATQWKLMNAAEHGVPRRRSSWLFLSRGNATLRSSR